VFDTVAVFDHANQRLLLSSCVHGDDPEGVEAAHTRALSRIAALRQAIAGAAPQPAPRLAGLEVDPASYERVANLTREDFRDRVDRALEYIVAGDMFQVQVSAAFRVATAGTSLRRLRRASSHQPEPVH